MERIGEVGVTLREGGGKERDQKGERVGRRSEVAVPLKGGSWQMS